MATINKNKRLKVVVIKSRRKRRNVIAVRSIVGFKQLTENVIILPRNCDVKCYTTDGRKIPPVKLDKLD